MTRSETYPASAHLGVVGWNHKEWVGGFFPGDMPEDWRLTYFNTQFGFVYLSREEWLKAGHEEWRRWGAECHDQFLFLLEASPEDVMPHELEGRCKRVEAGCEDVIWFDRNTDLKRLASALRERSQGVTWLISRDADLGQIGRVRTLLELLGVNA
ncbi:MAG: hypothetical protein HZB71_02505 [Betaproteobacteria bacterium]|nr:hypothetical protein [Betaproteobacteria bacterium]